MGLLDFYHLSVQSVDPLLLLPPHKVSGNRDRGHPKNPGLHVLSDTISRRLILILDEVGVPLPRWVLLDFLGYPERKNFLRPGRESEWFVFAWC